MLKSLFFALALAAAPALASPATEAFERLKSLEGEWDVSTGGTASYELVASGSVVLERLMGMVTTYYLDGDALRATHYCSAMNEPRFKATPESTADAIRFELEGVENLPDPSAGHMARLTFAFASVDEFTQVWTWRENGEDAGEHRITYKRK